MRFINQVREDPDLLVVFLPSPFLGCLKIKKKNNIKFVGLQIHMTYLGSQCFHEIPYFEDYIHCYNITIYTFECNEFQQGCTYLFG